MRSIDASDLKRRLGKVLDLATVAEVEIRRHGRVIAVLGPPRKPRIPLPSTNVRRRWTQAREARMAALCAAGDLRLSRWRRAGDPKILAGIAALLASVDGIDSNRAIALAESLAPGMGTVDGLSQWLETTPVDVAHFLTRVVGCMDRGS